MCNSLEKLMQDNSAIAPESLVCPHVPYGPTHDADAASREALEQHENTAQRNPCDTANDRPELQVGLYIVPAAKGEIRFAVLNPHHDRNDCVDDSRESADERAEQHESQYAGPLRGFPDFTEHRTQGHQSTLVLPGMATG